MPDDFTGIPVVNNQQSWFIPYKVFRKKDDVASLWQLFIEAVGGDPENLSSEIFDRCLQIRTVGIGKLTAGLFWINPEKFLSLDRPNRAYFADQGVECGKRESYDDYLDIMRRVREKLGTDFTNISYRHGCVACDEEVAPATVDVEEDDVRYWTLSPGNPVDCGRIY